MGMIVAGITSAGGLTGLAVKLSQKKNLRQEVTPDSSECSMADQDLRIGLAGIVNKQADARL
jgi:hypothetical protein